MLAPITEDVFSDDLSIDYSSYIFVLSVLFRGVSEDIWPLNLVNILNIDYYKEGVASLVGGLCEC